MLKNYLVIAWRNLRKNRMYSLINIGGLAIGMAVAILIGIWIFNELQFNKNFTHYNRIAQVMQRQTYNGEIGTQVSVPAVMGDEIRQRYGSDFKYIVQASWNGDHTLQVGDKILYQSGNFYEPDITNLLSLDMVRGVKDGLNEPDNIMLSQSVAEVYFADQDPIGKMIKIDNKNLVKVTGVYRDFPTSSDFNNLKFILPWKLYLRNNPWIEANDNPWGSNFTQCFVLMAENSNMQSVSDKIINAKFDKVGDFEKRFNPQIFLHPMSKWHLYSDFENGVNTGGAIDTLRLFGIIGIFVLLLACINFMNLSTARSEKRAREVGVRKAIGSMRGQLITQFFTEAILIAFISFVISIIVVLLLLPFFNAIADRNMTLMWSNAYFWLLCIGFTVFTGFIAGLYPAIYLSSFNAVKVLKGTFRAGRLAALPRKILVVTQFSISVILIIGTVIVYKQIQHASNRPVGYARDGLVSMSSSEDIHKNLRVMSEELKNSGVVVAMAESQSPATGIWNTNGGFNWEGKDPALAVDFPNNSVSYDYGQTIGWHIREGRDFSRDFKSDTAAFILNESAVKFIGLKDPVGKTIEWNDQPFTVIGVVDDILTQSPYKPVRAAMFHLSLEEENMLLTRLNPAIGIREGMSRLQEAMKTYNPSRPFVTTFVDEDFEDKFQDEKRIGQLAAFFSILAIFISCLGLFGLASFVAEQRVREIGIRKVLGASVAGLWQMLSTDFLLLVAISCAIAIPLSYLLMSNWLQKFDYRTNMPWWIFAVAAISALLITIFTTSFQAIRAAVANPVKSLRAE